MIGNRPLEQITIPEFEAWAASRGWAESMRYNSLWAIQGYMDWAGIESGLSRYKISRTIPPLDPYIILEQVKKLVSLCDTSTPKGLQDATIVVFFWDTWGRVDSVLNLELDHINQAEQEIHFHTMKGGNGHTVPYTLTLKDWLDRWLPVRATIARPGVRTLFINIRRGTALTYSGFREILEALGNKIGIHLTPHMFRRGAARHHASIGGSDRKGMERGGWKSYASYWRYTRGVDLDDLKGERWDD